MRARHGTNWRKRAAETNNAPALVHVHKHKNATRLAALDEQARRLGLRIDQGLTDAKAQYPDLDVVPYAPEADCALMDGIADWCDRYTPLVCMDGARGLFLDISGCAHLFGGEHQLVRDLLERLFHLGFFAQAAVADTAGAAHGCALFGAHNGPLHVPSGGEGKVLAPFGLAALRLDSETVYALERVGIKTIGQLMVMARAPVARRFGRQCLLRLDQALGHLDEVLSPRLPVADLTAERRLASPVVNTDDIKCLIHKLALHLKTDMEARGLGGRVFELALFRVDGVVKRLNVGASRPVRDGVRITTLFQERLAALGDELDAGYGFDVVRLSVLQYAPMDEPQGDFSVCEGANQDVDALMDRIAARLGHDDSNHHPVRITQFTQSHMPERAEKLVPYNGAPLKTVMAPEHYSPARPVRFFSRPEPIDVIAQVPEGAPLRFRWRRTLCQVVCAEGPERIAGQWWGDDDEVDDNLIPRMRDYYRVEDGDGRRYWIFRSGLYTYRDGPQGLPSWFMQGLFA